MSIFLIQGSQLIDSLTDIVLNLEFGHDIKILKMANLVEVDCIKIEPALPRYPKYITSAAVSIKDYT